MSYIKMKDTVADRTYVMCYLGLSARYEMQPPQELFPSLETQLRWICRPYESASHD